MNRYQFLEQFQHLRQVTTEPDYPLNEPGKPAAVLIPIVLHKNELNVIFTVRAKHLKHHGGQVSFPGGKQEVNDPSLMHTALRETHEEIGLEAKNIEIIGGLPIYRTVSRYEVKPYIGFVSKPLNLALDKNEVFEVFEVPLSFLLNRNNHYTHWVNRNNRKFPVYFIHWQRHYIWGATAAFVRNLSHHFS